MVVHNANGNSAALAREVGERASPGAGKLLYATAYISGDAVIRELAHHGFHVEVLRLYRASERATLSEAATAALDSGTVDAVMLFSPRSAHAFVQQVHRASLQDRCGNAVALCISHAVADALHPLRFAEIRVAAHPDRDGMLALLS
jgi:uroporphyrinogen-III synthase